MCDVFQVIRGWYKVNLEKSVKCNYPNAESKQFKNQKEHGDNLVKLLHFTENCPRKVKWLLTQLEFYQKPHFWYLNLFHNVQSSRWQFMLESCKWLEIHSFFCPIPLVSVSWHWAEMAYKQINKFVPILTLTWNGLL